MTFMKKLQLLILLLFFLTPVFAWASYGNDNINSFHTDAEGESVLIPEFSAQLSGSARFSPLIYDNKLFAFTDKLTVFNDDGSIAWVYDSGFVKNSPIIYEDSVIISSDKGLICLYLDGSLKWNVSSPIAESPLIVYNNDLIFSTANDVRAYNPLTGDLLWNNTSMTGCTSPGIILGNDLIIGCGSTIYSLDLGNNSVNFAKNLNYGLGKAITAKDNNIFVAVNNKIIALNLQGEIIGSIPFFSLKTAVNTNLASGDEVYACALNGLHAVNLGDDFLYYENVYLNYPNCANPVLFDYNNDGHAEILFSMNNSLKIINSEGEELASKTSDSKLFLTVDNLNNDGLAEVAALSETGKLTVYNTASPDNTVHLLLNGSGLIAEIINNGHADSSNATLAIIFMNESFSKTASIPSGGKITEFFKITPLVTGEFYINASITDAVDFNALNNNDSIVVQIFQITNDSGLEIISNNHFYDFNNNYESALNLLDVNGDKIKEYVINTTGSVYYDTFMENSNFYPIADLMLILNSFPDEVYENEALQVTASITNTGVYNITNAAVSLLVDGFINDTVKYDIMKNSTKSFSFNLSGLTVGYHFVKVRTDYDAEICENNEDNNEQSKGITVYETPLHELSVLIDTTGTTLYNNMLKIIINNSGTFNEDLRISSNPEFFTSKTVTSNKKTVQEYYAELKNIHAGAESFNLTISNQYYYFSHMIGLNFLCEYDNDCSNGEYCYEGECLAIPDKSIKVMADNYSNGTISAESNFLTGMLPIFSFDSDNKILYWVVVVILDLIASYGIYLVSYKLFREQAHLLGITNFILFIGITYVFEPANMQLVLLFELILSAVFFMIMRQD